MGSSQQTVVIGFIDCFYPFCKASETEIITVFSLNVFSLFSNVSIFRLVDPLSKKNKQTLPNNLHGAIMTFSTFHCASPSLHQTFYLYIYS